MSLPTTVFIVANAKREVHVGYTKDLEVTLSLIADGSYDASLAARGFGMLVYKEEQPTVREAIARVAEIEAMSPKVRSALINSQSPSCGPVRTRAPRVAETPKQQAQIPCFVYVLSGDSDDGSLVADLTTDLSASLILARAQARRPYASNAGLDRLVYYEYFTTIEGGRAKLKTIMKMGRERLRRLVKSVNPEWIDMSPSHLLATAEVSAFGHRLSADKDDGPDSSGGVTADLRGGPRTPTGVRTGGYEEPWPPGDD